jgi:hypothetical protein
MTRTVFEKAVYEYIKDNTCDGDVVYVTYIELIYKYISHKLKYVLRVI